MKSKQIDQTINFYKKQLKTNAVIQKLDQKDPSLWSKQSAEQGLIQNRLGWLDSYEFIHQTEKKILDLCKKIKCSQYSHFVWIGMGGSSLFAKTIAHTFESNFFHVIDSTDSKLINTCLDKVDCSKTLFFVASKSGTTLETISVFKYIRSLSTVRDYQFISISDPDTELSRLFSDPKESFFAHLSNPKNIGGRFSSLSYFGLLPFALIEPDVFKENVSHFKKTDFDDLKLSLVNFSTEIFAYYKINKSNKIVPQFSNELSYFTHWIAQLLAESTGKNGYGFLPISNQYVKNDRPDYIHVTMNTEQTQSWKYAVAFPISANTNNLLLQSYIWMYATALLGYFLELNPFDEPNVTLSKEIASKYLEKNNLETDAVDANDLNQELNAMVQENQDSISLLYFGSNTSQASDACKRLSSQYKLPFIFYQGPQYLHSVGQYFKGGHNDTRFIIVYEENRPLNPDQKHLEKIKLAQSLGDYEALKKSKRHVVYTNASSLMKLVNENG